MAMLQNIATYASNNYNCFNNALICMHVGITMFLYYYIFIKSNHFCKSNK